MKRIIFLMAAIVCLCSCEKQSHWLYDTWYGQYDTTMTDNDTGEAEQKVATILLQFSEDRTECVVTKGIAGLLAVTKKTYKVYLNETDQTFTMNEGYHDSRILYRGQVINFHTATLNWYAGEEMISVELNDLRDEYMF